MPAALTFVVSILLPVPGFAEHAAGIVALGDSLTAPRSGVVTYSELLSRSLTQQA